MKWKHMIVHQKTHAKCSRKLQALRFKKKEKNNSMEVKKEKLSCEQKKTCFKEQKE